MFPIAPIASRFIACLRLANLTGSISEGIGVVNVRNWPIFAGEEVLNLAKLTGPDALQTGR